MEPDNRVSGLGKRAPCFTIHDAFLVFDSAQKAGAFIPTSRVLESPCPLPNRTSVSLPKLNLCVPSQTESPCPLPNRNSPKRRKPRNGRLFYHPLPLYDGYKYLTARVPIRDGVPQLVGAVPVRTGTTAVGGPLLFCTWYLFVFFHRGALCVCE